MKFALNEILFLVKFALIGFINSALTISSLVICTKGDCEICTKVSRLSCVAAQITDAALAKGRMVSKKYPLALPQNRLIRFLRAHNALSKNVLFIFLYLPFSAHICKITDGGR